MDFQFVLILLIGGAVAFPAMADEYDYDCEARGGNFEGDILLTDRQVNVIYSGRYPVIISANKWVNNLVPYVIDRDRFSSSQLQLIQQAMSSIENVSAVRFRPKIREPDHLDISGEPTGCWSTLGRNREQNRMNLSPSECFNEGTIVHQLLHVLGFAHATNAGDRDFSVDINWNNVRPEHEKSLQLYKGIAVANYGLPYDEDSIMNFGSKHFARNRSDTIVLEGLFSQKVDRPLGQRQRMSVKDVRKLNLLHVG